MNTHSNKSEVGQGLIEWMLLVLLLIVVAAVVLTFLAPEISAVINQLTNLSPLVSN